MGFSLQFLKDLAIGARNLALTLVSVLAAILGGLGVYHTLRHDFVIVEPMRVPNSFEKAGLSGEIVTQHLLDEVAALNRSNTSAKERTRFGDKTLVESLSGSVGPIDIKAMQSVLQQLLGRPVARISGEILTKGEGEKRVYSVRLRRTPDRQLLVDIEVRGSPDEVIKATALSVMEAVETHVAAAIHYRRGNRERATQLINLVLTNDDPSDDKFSLNLRSVMLKEEGRLTEALKEVNELIKKEPNFWAAWGNAAGIYAGMGDFNEAIECINRAISLLPTDWRPQTEKGRIFLSFKRYDEALENFEKAIKLSPRVGQPYNFAGQVLLAKNDLQAAREMFHRGVSVAPELADLRFNYGQTLYRLGDKENGISEMKTAAYLNKNSYEYLVAIGEALLNSGSQSGYSETVARINDLLKQGKPVPVSLKPRVTHLLQTNSGRPLSTIRKNLASTPSIRPTHAP